MFTGWPSTWSLALLVVADESPALQDVSVIDVRGSVDTQLLHDNLEASTYTAHYDRQVDAQ